MEPVFFKWEKDKKKTVHRQKLSKSILLNKLPRIKYPLHSSKKKERKKKFEVFKKNFLLYDRTKIFSFFLKVGLVGGGGEYTAVEKKIFTPLRSKVKSVKATFRLFSEMNTKSSNNDDWPQNKLKKVI